jgi:POT family proton-dependent oligopeptide transporter
MLLLSLGDNLPKNLLKQRRLGTFTSFLTASSNKINFYFIYRTSFFKPMESTAPIRRKHPKGLYLLFFTEMWERFGYYLMLGILYLYMTDSLKGGLGYGEGTANDIYGTYLALVYLTPFIGGLLADRVFGYRKTIIFGGAMMAAGYLTLAFPGEEAFYLALFFIIIGNGFFKPNISTLLGNLYNTPEYKDMKDKGYNIFYMGINIGAFVCNFVAAYMRNNYGWGWAFAAAGVGMIIGLITFMAGQKNVAEGDIVKSKNPEDMSLGQIGAIIFLPALGFAALGYFLPMLLGVSNILGSRSNDVFLFACIPVVYFYLRTYLKADAEDKKPLGVLLYIFTVVIIFWMIFHQNGNVLTDWAERYTKREMSPGLESTANKFNLVEKVSATPRLVVKTDAEGKPEVVNGDTLRTEEYAKYIQNLPKEEWPQEGKNLSLISTELFQSLNPFFVVLFTPLVIAFFSFLGARGKEPSTVAKIAWGLFITGLSTVVMILAVSVSNNGADKVSAMWLVGTYAVITIGELCLSPMGLSLVSKLSPPRLTALMMGGWFLATSIGNKLSGVVGHLGTDSAYRGLPFVINFAGAMLSAVLLLIMVKSFSKVLDDKLKKS